MAPKNTRIGAGIDPRSAILGAGAAIALLAIAWFAFYQPQAAGMQPAPAAPSAPPVEVIGNSRLPSTFQVVVKNNERQNVRIQGFTIGGSNYNLTANLSPGEIKSFSIAPPECTAQQEYNCNVIIRYALSDGTGATASQNATGEGQEPEAEGGNETEQEGETAPVPLSILTAEMPSGTEDLEYGLSLEAEGGSGSYSWQAAGLPLELTAASNGRITGQALEAGTFTVHVAVSDGSSTVERDLQLVINANPN